MPISCECPQCGKRLKAADSAAGKKAKCPDCGAAVPIPALKPRKKQAIENDEFDLQKMNIDAGLEGPLEEDHVPCPMCGEMIKAAASKCRYCGEDLSAPRKKRKGRRGTSGGGMPATVIVAVAIEALFILFNVAGVVIQLVQMNIPGSVGSGVRLMIEIAVIAGLFQRKASSRTAALVLSGIGLVFMVLCGGVVLFASQLPQVQAQFPAEAKMLVAGILVAQVFMYVTQIAALVSGSAREFLDQ